MKLAKDNQCLACNRWFSAPGLLDHQRKTGHGIPIQPDTEPDWAGECEVCGASPIVPASGMCGPCTFGEAETMGGNW